MMRHRNRLLTGLVTTFAGTSVACGAAPTEVVEDTEQAAVKSPQDLLAASAIPQFVTPLTTLSGRRANGSATVSVDMEEFQQKVLPPQLYPTSGQFAAGTILWGYNVNGAGPSWPGATIESRQNTTTTVHYSNSLRGPNGTPPFLQRFLSVDLTAHWADPIKVSAQNHCVVGDENGGDDLTTGVVGFFGATLPDGAPDFTDAGELARNRSGVIGGFQQAVPAGVCQAPYSGPVPVVPHLHGAEVLSAFDGHPDAWFTPGSAQTGPGFVSTVYNYPNQQEATTLWFHDHSLGTTRLNVFSGLAAFYLLRDSRDTGLANNAITLPAGAFEQELLIQDRLFDKNGQLLFPDGSASSDGTVNGLEGAPPNPNLHPFAIPEFFGNVITVNGKSWPFLDVQPRRYRFRVLNGSNARFLQMQLFQEAQVNGRFTGIASLFTDTQNPPVGIPGPPIWQIGSDGGFLNAPVNVDLTTPGVPATGDPNSPHLFVAPAERSDIVVDFSGLAGKRFVLTNIAVTPYPGGGVVTESVLPPPAQQGGGNLPGPYETTTQIMEFRVDLPLQGTDTSFNPAGNHPPLRSSPIVDIKPADTHLPIDARRQIVLDEVEDTNTGGPVEVIINNSHWNGVREGSTQAIPGSISNGHGLLATEAPREGATELWEVANLTPDAHPLHIHLIQFQIINFQPFNSEASLCPFGAGPTFSPPAPGTPDSFFGPDGNFRFDFSGPQYRQSWDSLFPGGTFNGFTFQANNFIPGYGPPNSYFTANADGALGGNPAFSSNSGSFFVGDPIPPQPRDQGWKDTAKMFPCGVTRLAVRWAPQDMPAGSTHAGTDYFPFDPTTGGPGYVWHCHILDHEDNEMMRPILMQK
jgi:spore coat protein A, manganese oxidase